MHYKVGTWCSLGREGLLKRCYYGKCSYTRMHLVSYNLEGEGAVNAAVKAHTECIEMGMFGWPRPHLEVVGC